MGRGTFGRLWEKLNEHNGTHEEIDNSVMWPRGSQPGTVDVPNSSILEKVGMPVLYVGINLGFLYGVYSCFGG